MSYLFNYRDGVYDHPVKWTDYDDPSGIPSGNARNAFLKVPSRTSGKRMNRLFAAAPAPSPLSI